MKVEDGMSVQVLIIGPAHTLREAARMMAARQVGAAVVVNPDRDGVGILTERDILMSVAAGESPDTEAAGEPGTQAVVSAPGTWALERAPPASTARRTSSSRRATGPWRAPQRLWCGAASVTSWSSRGKTL